MTSLTPDGHVAATTVRAPSGGLDLVAAVELRGRLAAAHHPGAQVALDLSDVTFIDSSALSVVLAADRRLAATGGALRLTHVSGPVARVLRICGLAHLVLPTPAVVLHLPAREAAHLVQ